MKLAASYYDIAVVDIKASKTLFHNKLYSQSVFYFQQSVEKANKAFAILTEIISEEEAKFDRDHNTNKIYKRIIDKQTNEIEQYLSAADNFPDLKKTKLHKIIQKSPKRNQADAFKKFIDGFHHETNLSPYDISYVIRQLNLLKIRKIRFQKKILEINKKNLPKLLFPFYDAIGNENAQRANNEIEEYLADEKQLLEMSKYQIIALNLSIQFSKIYFTLFFYALISLPHSKYSRYPYPENKIFPIQFYNLKLPLVKRLPVLIEHFENTLKLMRTVFPELKSR